MSASKNDSIPTDETIVSSDEKEAILTKKEPPKKSRLPFYVVGIIIFAVLGGGLGWWLYTRQFVTTDDAFIEGYISYLNSKISAHIVKIHVQDNQSVKKGDLLIEFDRAELEVKLNQSKALLQTALANREKSRAKASLTRATGRAGLNQAESNLQTAKTNIEQTQMFAASRQNAIEQAKNQVRTAEASLNQVQAQFPAVNAEIAQAKSQVKVSQTKLELAQIEHDRNKTLFDSGVVSKQQVEQTRKELSEAQAALTLAEKQVEIAQARLNALQKQVEVERSKLNEAKAKVVSTENEYRQSLSQVDLAASQADESAGRLTEANNLPEKIAVDNSEIDVAEAEVAQAQTAVEQAELDLQYTKIYAPQDGFVARRTVQEGQLVQPDQPLMAITQPEIWVIANFKETQLEQMRAGQRVDIYIDAYPSMVFRGQVESFRAGTGSRFSVLPAENATGNFVKVVQRVPVKIVFDERPDNRFLLVPGMSVVPKVWLK
jgi:membrane fusion protein (multidrug efflux system)